MNGINKKLIPRTLTSLKQWVLWKTVVRDDRPTKLPFAYNGSAASSTDPATWGNFSAIEGRYQSGGYSGVGFVFAPEGGIVGIDLDGCRDPETGRVEDWAKEIIHLLDSYTEVSPSKTGVKVFCLGKNPMASGGNKKLPHKPRVAEDKEPGVEIYDQGRYFAVTGWRLKGMPDEPQERQEQIDSVVRQFWPAAEAPAAVHHDFRSDAAVVDRARKYMARKPGAVAGSGGHNSTFNAACILVHGFDLGRDDALALLREWNASCDPPWSEKELSHKIDSAIKKPGERGYLRNASPQRWDAISVPNYATEAKPAEAPVKSVTTLADAMTSYIDTLAAGGSTLIELGLGEVDYAVGGGVEAGELIVLAARPSHGKSAVALQCVHSWTSCGRPCFIVSEEMSAIALGKRALQYTSDTPQEHWATRIQSLRGEVDYYKKNRAPAFIVESVGTVDAAVALIEKAVAEHKIQAAIVDYAQILRGQGKTRYEQVSDTSIKLKQLAARNGIIVLMLCQLSREIEKRNQFTPVMSDLRESGQIEQDADVIMFLVWPHKIDSQQPAHEYKFYIAKNRNRAINQSVVRCRFIPSRQMVMDAKPADQERRVSRNAVLDGYNDAPDDASF